MPSLRSALATPESLVAAADAKTWASAMPLIMAATWDGEHKLSCPRGGGGPGGGTGDARILIVGGAKRTSIVGVALFSNGTASEAWPYMEIIATL